MWNVSLGQMCCGDIYVLALDQIYRPKASVVKKTQKFTSTPPFRQIRKISNSSMFCVRVSQPLHYQHFDPHNSLLLGYPMNFRLLSIMPGLYVWYAKSIPQPSYDKQKHFQTLHNISWGQNHLHQKFLHVCGLNSFSSPQLFATPWTVAHWGPLSMGYSRQGYLSGLWCPSPGDFPDPGIKSASPATPALQVDSLPLSHWWRSGFWWEAYRKSLSRLKHHQTHVIMSQKHPVTMAYNGLAI